MPAEHKATLIEVLTQTLRDEVLQLKAFLHGRAARSWQHADECVMHLAAQLHRDPASIRDKATELGLGVAVDYRFARQFNLGRED